MLSLKRKLMKLRKLQKKNKKIVNIGIRLNPNTDAKTISKISTGKKEDKFGLDKNQIYKLLKKYNNSKFINIICLSVHIGSQITSHKPYLKMLNVLDNFIKKSKYNFRFIDLGGGMGIKYSQKDKVLDLKKYVSSIKSFLKNKRCKIILEPGRSIIGNTGYLISKVIYVKKASKKNFVIMDVAMNDMIRPALYGAKHNIFAAKKNNTKVIKEHEFVGPICETTDKFLTKANFQKLKENDNLIINDVGAYGIVLSSNYNLRPMPPEILVKGSKTRIIRKRQKYKDII